jgi:ADP-ribose pyrophosphatase YjhB (NUDIX family)
MAKERVTRVAAYGLLQRNGELLLCRLSQQVGINQGHWTLPGGGLDFGEDPEHAVVREFAEETGLTVKVDKLIAIDSLCDSIPGWSPMHSIRIIYSVTHVSGELRFEQQGSTDLCAWHSHNQTKDLPLVDLARRGIEFVFG